MFNHLKGFSLIEVLVALLLVSTLVLSLFEQQISNKLMLNRIHSYTKASNLLDNASEELLASPRFFTAPTAIHLDNDFLKIKVPGNSNSLVLKRAVSLKEARR